MHKLASGFKRTGYLARAIALAAVLGVIEIVQSQRGRRVLGALVLAGVVGGVAAAHPIRAVAPGEAAVRVDRLTGGVTILDEGWVIVVPFVHDYRTYPLRDQVYRPANAAKAGDDGAFQSSEGLSIGIDVSVRWALDPDKMAAAARLRPDELGDELVQPTVDGVLHRAFAAHTVREIFTTERAAIQRGIEAELRDALAGDGVIVKTVAIGSVSLPDSYRDGLEALLAAELEAGRAAKEAETDGVRRRAAAEAAGAETVIAAKAQAEAMQHVLPLKQKEIEEKRLEAEAAKVVRLTEAEATAQARRIESLGEADSRRVLADSDAYRFDAMGKAEAVQMAREGELIEKNPLLIQKTLADKLSDKISVIVAPPQVGGFFASGLLGGGGGANGANGANGATGGQGYGGNGGKP